MPDYDADDPDDEREMRAVAASVCAHGLRPSKASTAESVARMCPDRQQLQQQAKAILLAALQMDGHLSDADTGEARHARDVPAGALR